MTQRNVDVKQAILGFLSSNPGATGTVETIMEWWILEQRIEQCLAEVQSALSDLVEEGIVIEKQSSQSPPIYELNQRRLNEVRRWLGSR